MIRTLLHAQTKPFTRKLDCCQEVFKIYGTPVESCCIFDSRAGIVRLIVQRSDQPVGAAYCTDAHCLSLSSSPLSCRNHRSLRLVILSLCLSFRDVEEMLAMRGVVLTYETVREWCLKFGQTYANNLRRRSPRPGDQWHLDEVFLKINGRIHYLWRAVDQDGEVLDILVKANEIREPLRSSSANY